MIKNLSLVTVLFFLMFAAVRTAAARTLSAPTIVSFTSDLPSVTPDEAESGTKYTALTWQTADLSAGDQVFLQVFVLSEWHDVRAEAFPANAVVHWAIAHTLDFAPPAFRLVIRDGAGHDVTSEQLVIPYTTSIDPNNQPTVALYVQAMGVLPGTHVPVSWIAKNRPARSNLRFIQHLSNGTDITVELPRQHQWVQSSGEGVVVPIADGKTLTLGVQVFNIDTGEIYTAHLFTVPALLPAPMPTATYLPTPFPSSAQILSLQANAKGIHRGDALKVSWQTRQASVVTLKVFDIDDHPSRSYRQAKQTYNKLAASGSLDLPSAADYPGSGWEVVLEAGTGAANEAPTTKSVNVLFTDVEQPIWFHLPDYSASSDVAKPGETLTVHWQANMEVRGLDANDMPAWMPTHLYDNKLFLDLKPTNDADNAPPSPLAGHFEHQPLTGSVQWQVPALDPSYTVLQLRFGVAAFGYNVTYEVRSVSLVDRPDTTTSMQAAYQAFDNGFLIWNGSNGDVYVFQGVNSGAMQTFPQNVYASNPDPTGLTPPTGRSIPINAFGKVWSWQSIREALGWPLAPEQGYTMTVTNRPLRDAVNYTLPTGQTITVSKTNWSKQ